jgi:hypothetical protein
MRCPRLLNSLSLLFGLLLFVNVLPAFSADGDFDGDGLSDPLIVRIPSSNDLRWRAYMSSDSFESIARLGEHGVVGDNLVPANWLSTSVADIGIVKKQGTDVVWSVLDQVGEATEHTFGTTSDYLISGGDFDGNGYADAALVKRSGVAQVQTNLFTTSPTVTSRAVSELTFPRKVARKGRPLFYRVAGENTDSLAVIQLVRTGKRRKIYVMHTRNLAGQKQKITLGSVFGGVPRDAMPIMTPAGEEAVLLVSGGRKTRVKIKSVSGELLYRGSFAKKRTVIVGDYLSAAGDEFAVEMGSEKIKVINPFSGESTELNVGSGVIADHVNVVTFRSTGPTGSGGGGGDGGTSGGGTKPGGGLGSVCSSVTAVSQGALYKPASDVSDNRGGKPAVLFTGSYKTGASDLKIYASNGTQVCNFPFKASSESGVNNGADHYFSGWHGGCNLTGSQLASAARAAAGSAEVYIQWKGGGCLGPVSPTQRHGGI